ncbi:hypothetical protein [Oryzihumus sp.]|uniref:hypothetical protein n=1 Tax=Oryzihumus sp. TaxID=1968903 RepID=UPI002ED92D92
MKNVLSPARIGAAFVVAPAVIVLAGGPALAADSVSVSNTETVQAHLDASGHVRDARVYEQLALQGHGTVTVSDPVSTKNLRNLDGFGGFDVKGGDLVANVSVDGERRLRAVSDFTKELPLKVTATYTLDGKKVEPGDVVGRSGLLEVHYVVENVTGRDQEVSFDDGTGTKVTRTEKVVIPMVGSLTTVLPSTFTDVRSDEAAIAGDGHGGTKMTFTMTLFGPIGSPRAEFGYAAKVTDGVVPAATVSALPVSPLDSPSFKGGAASYKGGADTGVELTSGATQIDSNVLKLRDGAAQLLAGLIKLRDGAKDLNAGLAGKAAPGAAKLASGAGALKSGTGKLATGARAAKAGATQLSSGSTDLASGANDLADGVGQISGGLDQLAGVQGLPAALQGLKDLRAGLDHPVGATGASDPGGLLQGLQQIAGGLSNPGCSPANPTNPQNPCGVTEGLASVRAGVSNPACSLADPTNATNPCGVKEVVGYIQSELAAAGDANGSIAKLGDAAKDAYAHSVMAPSVPCPTSNAVPLPPVVPPSVLTASPLSLPANNTCVELSNVVYGIQLPSGLLSASDPGGVVAQTKAAGDGLGQVLTGIDGRLLPGITSLQAGVTRLTTGAGNARDAVQHLVLPGVDDLTDGISAAVFGVDQLADGAAAAADGADQVAGGASQVAGGAKKLDSGLGQLSSGAGQLDTGAGQLKSGADQLSSGLGDAATGSGKLADGLDTAAGKAPALEDGASRLSAEGTTKLVDAGKGTAADYGLKYALIEAGAQRAKAEGMAYGAPAGASGATAYSLELAGMSGEGSRNVGRGLGAVAVFGLGAGLTVLRRRWL